MRKDERRLAGEKEKQVASAKSEEERMLQRTAGKYDDIIDLPRPKLKHARMSAEARAAQFAPFAALVGYESMVQETKERVIEEVEHETEIDTTEFASDIEYEDKNGLGDWT